MAASFQELQLGDALGPKTLLVTREQVRAYAKYCGITAMARFMDDEGARKEGLPGMILPGDMSGGLIAKLVTDWATPMGAHLSRLGTTYRSPVQPDIELVLQGFVTQTDPEAHSVDLDVWMENGEGDRLVIGTATVKFAA